MARAVILGCLGPILTKAERRFFARIDPWGFILFARNVENPGQLARLTGELRESVGRSAPILIDQEGGRVARLRGPAWRDWAPALEECARLPAPLRARAMRLRYRLIAGELAAVGVDVNCAPVLDLLHLETHGIIRDRCYGAEPGEVAEIGRAVAEGLLDGGVLPVIKHMPGQGRAPLDSHLELPTIMASPAELALDFAPFRALCDLPLAMTAHVVYAALDPHAPATQSTTMIRLIREDLGFQGLLITDDLSMRALRGSFSDRVERAVSAGCDVILHCNGNSVEAAKVGEVAPRLEGLSLRRAEAALGRRGAVTPVDLDTLAGEFAALERAVHA